jgi:AcrR family transcriptional regulator
MRVRDINKETVIRRQAVEMLVREGLDGFSMQKLAKAANVSPATLYIYYEDREDLIYKIGEEIVVRMMGSSLEGLHPKMSFAEGLEIQWKNRLNFFLKHQLDVEFVETLRYSHFYDKMREIIHQKFGDVLRDFCQNAINRGELVPLPFEVFWSVAYAPLYQLIKFHKDGKTHKNLAFSINEEVVNQTLLLVLKALKP